MRRFVLPALLLLLAAVALVVNVPVFQATGSANLSFSLILLSGVSVLAALSVAVWRIARG